MENMLNVRLAVITNSTYKTKYFLWIKSIFLSKRNTDIKSFVVDDFCPTLALLFISFWEGGLHRLLPLSLPGGSEAACR